MTERRAGYVRGVADEDVARPGKRLREGRDHVGLMQDEVATRLGVVRRVLLRIEAGQRKVNALELRRSPGSTRAVHVGSGG